MSTRNDAVLEAKRLIEQRIPGMSVQAEMPKREVRCTFPTLPHHCINNPGEMKLRSLEECIAFAEQSGGRI